VDTVTSRVEFEVAHLRAAEKALHILKGLDKLQERVFLGAGCTDSTLTIEFLEEHVRRMRDQLDLGSVNTDYANVTPIGTRR
jgi:hypothetical protein